MDIIGIGFRKLHEIRLKRMSAAERRLIEDTSRSETRLALELKRIGLQPEDFRHVDYYSVLGIGHTDSHAKIREAYAGLMKKYHPDVNKAHWAALKAIEINEAYAVLKDIGKKAEYDKRIRDKTSFDAKIEAAISNVLIEEYSRIRNRDFDEFNKRVAMPQRRDSILAAVEDVADWNRRFEKAVSKSFGKIYDIVESIKSLEATNRRLLEAEKDQERLEMLKDNLARLKTVAPLGKDAEAAMKKISEKVRKGISVQESNFAERMRRSVE